MPLRLTREEEKLVRDMLEGMAPTGGFSCRVDCIQRMLGEIDTLRDIVARHCDTERMTRDEIRIAVDASDRLKETTR
jgi:hypothetical protein